MATIECGGFLFFSNFDSGNLARVEWVPRNESAAVSVTKNGKESADLPDVEFNLWTKPDCMGTEYENGNRTWFYFGIKGYLPHVLVKLNLVDLNRQAKMYSQGMAPVFRMVPGKPNWERVRDKVSYSLVDNIFTLSFKYRTPDNCDTVTYFAFTYPYTYTELQTYLNTVDEKFSIKTNTPMWDDIYYVRECVVKSLENRRVDLITISSYYNISTERETRLKLLFPETDVPRPFKFKNKKVIFISARVHPGETPSSFVFNGFLNLILTRDDPIAIILRRMYVFKLIPFLNPDGVYKGHYRTDTRGVNLNRVYLNPSFRDHPSVYAARALIRYYHFGYEKEDIIDHESLINMLEFKSSGSSMGADNNMTEKVQDLSLNETDSLKGSKNENDWCNKWKGVCHSCGVTLTSENSEVSCILKHTIPNDIELCYECSSAQGDSGLYMYIDMHGHASKKGIFMYGNHFQDIEKSVECMLLPKLMSLNNHNFHFTACNFTERNMYLKDRRDGMSREGSGRVAVLKITGLVKSYTLECNYNTGRLVNVLPPTVKEGNNKAVHTLPLPPKYTPAVFEEVGKAIGASILDLSGHNPQTRIPNSEFHSLNGMQEWLRVNVLADMGISRLSARNKLPNNNNNNQNKTNRPKSLKATGHKVRTLTKHTNTMKCKPTVRAMSVPADRKENIVYARESNVTNQTTPNTPLSKNFTRTTSSKAKGLTIRGKVKNKPKQRPYTQDGTQPHKSNLAPNKLKSDIQVSKSESPKRLKISSSYHRADLTNDRYKLKEICFVKQNLSKKIVAKFNKDSEYDDNEDIVVAWDEDCSPRVLGLNDLPESSTKCSFKVSEASTSSKVPSRGSSLKSSSFMSNKIKRTKTSLRRLASANIDSTNKVEKLKKRKKLKSKII